MPLESFSISSILNNNNDQQQSSASSSSSENKHDVVPSNGTLLGIAQRSTPNPEPKIPCFPPLDIVTSMVDNSNKYPFTLFGGQQPTSVFDTNRLISQMASANTFLDPLAFKYNLLKKYNLLVNSHQLIKYKMEHNSFDVKGLFHKSDKASSSTGSPSPTLHNKMKKKRSRAAFSHSQVYELEKRFSDQKYLSGPERSDLAQSKLYPKSVSSLPLKWFLFQF